MASITFFLALLSDGGDSRSRTETSTSIHQIAHWYELKLVVTAAQSLALVAGFQRNCGVSAILQSMP